MISLDESIAIAGCAGSFLGFCTYHISIARELQLAKRETSRFPLFAARSRLVDLVISGKMREKNRAWRDAYETVNFLLDMHQRLHLLDYLSRYIQSMLAAQRSTALRNRLEKSKAAAARAESAVPEFAEARLEVSRAFVFMLRMRTNQIQWTSVYALAASLRVIATAVDAGFGAAIDAAKIARKSGGDVSPDQLQAWHTDDGCPA